MRDGATWVWDTPSWVVDPLFEHELALELHMPVGELHDRMSLHELAVRWPLYFRYRAAQIEKQRERQRRGL
jgi:hypothetical protein